MTKKKKSRVSLTNDSTILEPGRHRITMYAGGRGGFESGTVTVTLSPGDSLTFQPLAGTKAFVPMINGSPAPSAGGEGVLVLKKSEDQSKLESPGKLPA